MTVTSLPARTPPAQLAAPAATDAWGDAYRLWLANYERPNTRRAYARDYRSFYRDVPVHPSELDMRHLIVYRELLTQRGLSKATIHRRMSAISSFYAFVNARLPHLREDNPLDGVMRPKVNPYGKATVLTGEQARQLLDSVAGRTVEDIRDNAALRLFLTTGVRLSVVAAARWADLTRRGDDLHLSYANKGGDERTRRLPQGTADALRAYWRVSRREGWLFDFGADNENTRRAYIEAMVVARCDAVLGVGHGITAHSLRHTAAVLADAHGASLIEISEMLDHANVQITALYLEHVRQGAGDRAIQLVDEVLR